MCIAPLTGAGLNPARAFGPAVFDGFGSVGDWLLAFALGPIVGAVLAAQIYTAVVIVPQRRTEGVEPEVALAGGGSVPVTGQPAPATGPRFGRGVTRP
jgi:hypothetical protein